MSGKKVKAFKFINVFLILHRDYRMFAKFKQKLVGTVEKKRLISNILSLSVLQGANYILPLLTLPYLVRVIGIEYFGLLAFATAINTYFMLITDYGFNLSATRQISIHREDKNKINDIFSAVMMIKAMLLIISLALLTLLVFSFEKLGQHWRVYFLTFGMVVGQALFPIWLFQGMERMKYIAYLNIGSKVFFTLCIFIFVHEQDDYLLVPLFTSLGFIVAGVWSLYLVNKKLYVRFKWQAVENIKWQLVDGWHVFISKIMGSLYRSSNVVILGLLTNNIYVGYYSIIERLVKALQSMQDVIGNALFPYFSKTFQEDKKYFFILLKKYFLYIVVIYSLAFLIIFNFSEDIVKLVFNENNHNMIVNLKIMGLTIIFGGLNYILGVLGLIALDYKKEFSYSVFVTAISSLILCVIFVLLFKDLGAAIVFVLSEIILLIMVAKKLYFIKRNL